MGQEWTDRRGRDRRVKGARGREKGIEQPRISDDAHMADGVGDVTKLMFGLTLPAILLSPALGSATVNCIS